MTLNDQQRTLTRPDCVLAWKRSGTGTPIVWIQGVGVQGDAWRPQTEAFESHFSSLTFDNRGMGASTVADPRASFSIGDLADDTLALMDEQGWETAHIVGHSMGGIIAQEVALRARARVLSLTLMCTFHRGPQALALTAKMMSIGLRSRVGTKRMRRRAFLEIVLSPEEHASSDLDVCAEELALLFGHDLAVTPPIAMKQLFAMRDHDASARLHELTGIRTLVMSGAEDPLALPAYGRALAEAIPGSRFVAVPGAAHGLPIQHAAETNELLRAHFMG
jgi:pimeloyl-ACP methyl ester carboxylesterase